MYPGISPSEGRDTVLDIIVSALGGYVVEQAASKVVAGARRITTGPVIPGGRISTTFLKKTASDLRVWKDSDGVSDQDFKRGQNLAEAILRERSFPTVDDFIQSSGQIEPIIQKWLMNTASDGENSGALASRDHLMHHAISAALLDTEYSSPLQTRLLLELVRARIPVQREQETTLSAGHLAVALAKGREKIDSLHLRRTLDVVPSAWPHLVQALEYDWANDVRSRLRNVREGLRNLKLSSNFQLHVPPRDLTFDSIRISLRTGATAEQLKNIYDLLRDLRRNKKIGNLEANSLISDIQWLQMEAKEPSYAACLPISGSWGAGKSDLLGEIANEARNNSVPALILEPGPLTLNGAILEAASNTFARKFDSTEQLASALQSVSTWALIVIDDLDKWIRDDPNVLRQLLNEIRSSTAHRSLRWTFTGDTFEVDRFHRGGDKDFWRIYGYRDPDGTDWRKDRHLSTGWFDLDEYNDSHKVGEVIARTALDKATVDDLVALHSHELGGRKIGLSLLNRPRVASMLAIRNSLESESPSTSEEDFFAEYWRHATASLELSAGMKVRFQEMVTGLTEHFVINYADPMAMKDLQFYVLGLRPSIDEMNVFSEIVSDLESLGCISQVNDYAVMRSEPIWAQPMAAGLEDISALQVHDLARELSPWAHTDEPRVEYLGAFYVRAVFEALGIRDETLSTRLLAHCQLISRKYSNRAIWLSLLSQEASVQSAVAKKIHHEAFGLHQGRDEFALLYWLRNAPDGIWQTLPALQTIAPRFEAISHQLLEPFLLRTLDRILRKLEVDNTQDATEHATVLRESWRANVGRKAAEMLTQALAQHLDHVEILEVLNSYFIEHGTDRLITPSNPNITKSDFDRSFFYEMINVALDRDFSASSRLILHSSWGNDEHGMRAYHMSSNGRVAIGRQFVTQRSQVHRLVDELLSEESRTDLESAFFIIRHSVLTHKNREVRVDRSWRPALTSIRSRKHEFKASLFDGWVDPLLRANGT